MSLAAVVERLRHAPLPSGLDTLEPASLACWQQGSGQEQPVRWEQLPRGCDPCYVLDSPANRNRRRGTLEEQLAVMALGRHPDDGCADDAGPPQANCRPGLGPTRGQQKRWQARMGGLWREGFR